MEEGDEGWESGCWWWWRVVREEVKTKAVLLPELEPLPVVERVVGRIGLQSPRLMDGGAGDFRWRERLLSGGEHGRYDCREQETRTVDRSLLHPTSRTIPSLPQLILFILVTVLQGTRPVYCFLEHFGACIVSILKTKATTRSMYATRSQWCTARACLGDFIPWLACARFDSVALLENAVRTEA
ncbi:hypothetical protein BKA93DRAFT_877469 [Sparassis latifolia]